MKLQEQQLNWDWNEIDAKLDTTSIKDFPGNTDPVTTGTKISDADFETFKTLLANKLNFRLTDEKHKFLNAWRRAENTNASNNPFATTINYKNDPGMTKFNLANNGQGVKNFSTVEFGADATAKTLSLRYYTNLVNQLRNDQIDSLELAGNPELKKWGTGGLVAKILNNNQLINMTTDNSLKTIIDYNTIIMEAANDIYNVFTNNPEKYFKSFSGVINDDEAGAAKYAKQAYVNGWLRNTKHPEKSLLEINRKLQEIRNQVNTQQSTSDTVIKINNAAKKIQENIKTLTAVVNTISNFIATGKQNTVTAKFYRYYDNKWNDHQVVYKWDYM
jgi:hypothetical protein